MKKLNTIFNKTQLLLAMVLFAATMVAQPVIKVPPTCNVVFAGSGVGATTGLGGQVGNGGIVCMPDPFPADVFTYVPNSTSVTGWALLGDLSMLTGTLSGSPIAGAGAVTSVKIQSYNKSLRAAEYAPIYPLSNQAWARSKGRVTVSYSASCGGSITFDVYKTYSNTVAPGWAPPIVGPDCVEPNKTYTYSVDQIASDNAIDAIGFDKYYWTGLPAGATNTYTSADNSSITFTTPTGTVPPFTLICSYGRCNPWDGDTFPTLTIHNTYVKKPVGAVPLAPTLTPALNLSPTPNCLPTGTSSYVVTISPIGGYNYVWTCSNATWALAQTGVQNSILTITNLDNNPGTLTLTVTNGSCTPVAFNYIINRTLAPSLGITGLLAAPAAPCISSATSYSLPQNALGNNTNWTISPVVTGGPTVVNGAGSGSTCTVTPGTAGGQFSLIATATATTTCITTNTSYTFNVVPTIPTINPASPVCVNRGTVATAAFTCTTISGATGYAWDVSGAPGWTCNTGCSTTSATFIPNGTTAGPVTIRVKALGATGASCDGAFSATYSVNYKPVTPTLTTTNCMIIGGTTSSVAVTNAQTFGTYTVTSVPAGITSSGVITAGNLSLTIPLTLTAGTYSITVNHVTTSCGTLSTTLSSITVGANTAAWAAGFPSYDSTVGGSDVYRVNTQPAGTTYQWYTGPATFTTISALTLIPPGTGNPNVSYSPSGNQMTLYGNTLLTNPQVYCVITPTSGCPTIISAARGTHGTAKMTTIAIGNEKVKIYPNPNDGNFNIKVDSVKETATATVTDMTGKRLGTYPLTKGENKIKTKNLAIGTYIVVVEIDGQTESQQIIIK